MDSESSGVKSEESGAAATTPAAGAGPDAAPVKSAAPPVAIRTRGLTKVYGDKTAVDSLDLEIRQGDVFGYIGPNGAGKTTTIRILAALLAETGGTAEVLGVDVRAHPRRVKALVGYMPDSFGVYENMTLGEYLAFFAAAYKIPRGRRRRVIDDVLELTDLGPKRQDLVVAFSRGMKQRACLAKTLLHDPQVLLLDEPASGLDPRARIEFRELLKELQRLGKTVLVSSHILTELSAVCNSIGIIEKGRLIVAGGVETILKSLRTQRVFTVTLLQRADAERAIAFLEKQNGVQQVEPFEALVKVSLDATDEDVAQIFEGLIGERIRLVGFQEELVDLETAFLTLTRGELA